VRRPKARAVHNLVPERPRPESSRFGSQRTQNSACHNVGDGAQHHCKQKQKQKQKQNKHFPLQFVLGIDTSIDGQLRNRIIVLSNFQKRAIESTIDSKL
jgi:hypothetical protein